MIVTLLRTEFQLASKWLQLRTSLLSDGVIIMI